VEKQKQKSFSSQKGSPQGTNEQASKFKEEEVLSVTVRRREKQRACGLRVQNLRLPPPHRGSSARQHTNKQTNWGLKYRRKRSSSSSKPGIAKQSKQTCSSLESIPCCKEDSQSGNFIFLEQQATGKLEEHKGTEQENTIWRIWIQHQIGNFLLLLKKTFRTSKETDDSRERNTKMEEDVDYVKAAASLQRQTQVRGSRSWRQTDRRRNKSTSNNVVRIALQQQPWPSRPSKI
jgi:hypothetical protein